MSSSSTPEDRDQSYRWIGHVEGVSFGIYGGIQLGHNVEFQGYILSSHLHISLLISKRLKYCKLKLKLYTHTSISGARQDHQSEENGSRYQLQSPRHINTASSQSYRQTKITPVSAFYFRLWVLIDKPVC